MNRKVFTIGILLVFLNGCNLIAQKKITSNIQKSIEAFEKLSNEDSNYKLEFLENEKTLCFSYSTSENKRIKYKAILDDIHPEGFFITKIENKIFLRILSIHDWKVFIKENNSGKHRLSNNTNLIDIELPPNFETNELSDLIEKLKSIFVKEEKKQPIKIIEPPRTKN